MSLSACSFWEPSIVTYAVRSHRRRRDPLLEAAERVGRAASAVVQLEEGRLVGEEGCEALDEDWVPRQQRCHLQSVHSAHEKTNIIQNASGEGPTETWVPWQGIWCMHVMRHFGTRDLMAPQVAAIPGTAVARCMTLVCAQIMAVLWNIVCICY